MLAAKENNIIGIESLKKVKPSLFKFRCKGDTYICDVNPDEQEKLTYQGRVYYQCRDFSEGTLKLFKMDKNIRIGGVYFMDTENELNQLYEYSKDFEAYHKRALPLCAAENLSLIHILIMPSIHLNNLFPNMHMTVSYSIILL